MPVVFRSVPRGSRKFRPSNELLLPNPVREGLPTTRPGSLNTIVPAHGGANTNAVQRRTGSYRKPAITHMRLLGLRNPDPRTSVAPRLVSPSGWEVIRG